MNVYENMKQLGIALPPAPPRGGLYTSIKSFGDGLYYVSGCGTMINGQGPTGQLGKDLTITQGQEAARRAMLNFLALVEKEINDLTRISSFVKLLIWVSSTDCFYDQPNVANGATELLVNLFGEKIGSPARSAVAAHVLPGNIPIEIEGIIEVMPQQ